MLSAELPTIQSAPAASLHPSPAIEGSSGAQLSRTAPGVACEAPATWKISSLFQPPT